MPCVECHCLMITFDFQSKFIRSSPNNTFEYSPQCRSGMITLFSSQHSTTRRRSLYVYHLHCTTLNTRTLSLMSIDCIFDYDKPNVSIIFNIDYSTVCWDSSSSSSFKQKIVRSIVYQMIDWIVVRFRLIMLISIFVYFVCVFYTTSGFYLEQDRRELGKRMSLLNRSDWTSILFVHRFQTSNNGCDEKNRWFIHK